MNDWQKSPSATLGLTVIVPIKVPALSYLEGFAASYHDVLQNTNSDTFELLIVDDCPDHIYGEIDAWFKDTRAVHFRPDKSFKTGANGKLNSVRSGLQLASHDMILLLDDDFRPTAATLDSLKAELEKSPCLKCMVAYISPTVTDLINSCGIFCVNTMTAQRQFCGHIGFHHSIMKRVGFPSSDGLFDELVIERAFQKSGMTAGYARNVFLEIITHGRAKFFEQRLRYAYENMAYPFRFICYLLVCPLLILLGWLVSLTAVFGAVLLITVCVTIICLVGQRKYAANRYPRWTFLLACCWFWPYTIYSWLAIISYCRGGILFGGRRVRSPA